MTMLSSVYRQRIIRQQDISIYIYIDIISICVCVCVWLCRYCICVEHDLCVLDYLSDFICVLYGAPSAYGVVTMPFSVREGINIFLAGFVPTENLRYVYIEKVESQMAWMGSYSVSCLVV
jgi:translation initiation factor RLI1